MNGATGLGHRAIEGTRLMLLSIGLLVLRAGAGGLMMTHGWAKLSSFSSMRTMFGDPIGLGVETSLVLTIFAELVCAGLVVLGLATRLAAIPLIIAMAVAGFVVHAADSLQKKELAFLYLAIFVALAFTGAGRYSLDALIARRWRRPRA